MAINHAGDKETQTGRSITPGWKTRGSLVLLLAKAIRSLSGRGDPDSNRTLPLPLLLRFDSFKSIFVRGTENLLHPGCTFGPDTFSRHSRTAPRQVPGRGELRKYKHSSFTTHKTKSSQVSRLAVTSLANTPEPRSQQKSSLQDCHHPRKQTQSLWLLCDAGAMHTRLQTSLAQLVLSRNFPLDSSAHALQCTSRKQGLPLPFKIPGAG